MSTVNVALSVSETTNRSKRRLMESALSISDVDEFAVSKVKLELGESIELEVDKLLICSVNIKILIQIQVGANTISFDFNSSMILPANSTVTITNPSDNSVTLPAVVSYVAI